MNYGVRDLCSIEPIKSLADIQGKKIRVIQSPTIVKAWKLIGANPTPIPSAEVYLALQSKLIDCAEFPPSSYVSFKRYEVAKNWTQVGYLYSFQYILLSNQWVEKLPPEHLETMTAVAAELSPKMFDDSEKEESAALDVAQKFGATIYKIADRDQWVARVTPMFDEYASKTDGGKALLDEVRAL
jgi:TRAP-type C4-dicarboxylate transport system substrate-binding protein